jgi:hypothetical protein
MHVHPKTKESVLRKANSNLLAKIIDEIKHLKNDAGRARMSSERSSDDYGSSDIFSSCSFPFLCDYYGWHTKLKKLKLEFFLDNDDGYIQDFEYFKNPYEYKKRENYREFKKYIEKFYQKGQDDTKLYEKTGFIKIQYNNSVTSYVPEPLFDNPYGMFKVTKMELDKLILKYSNSQKTPKCQSLNGWMALEPIDRFDNSKLELQKRESDASLWKRGFGSNEVLNEIRKSMHQLNSKLDQVNMQLEDLTYKLSLDNGEAQSQ